MRDDELTALLDDIESDRAERKESFQEERILAERRRYRDAPADIQPLRDVDISELDQTLFREIYGSTVICVMPKPVNRNQCGE